MYMCVCVCMSGIYIYIYINVCVCVCVCVCVFVFTRVIIKFLFNVFNGINYIQKNGCAMGNHFIGKF